MYFIKSRLNLLQLNSKDPYSSSEREINFVVACFARAKLLFCLLNLLFFFFFFDVLVAIASSDLKVHVYEKARSSVLNTSLYL